MPPRWTSFLCFGVLQIVTINAFSASSPWAPAKWILTLDFGSPIPNGYSSSRSAVEDETGRPQEQRLLVTRIVTKMEIQVTSANAPTLDRFLGPGASVVNPLSDGMYITLKGQQSIQLSPGGWTLAHRTKPKASLLQLWMELECDVRKNEFVLPRGERLYLTTQAWRETEYDLAVKTMRPIYERYAQAETTLQRTLSHESGDRRLDGKDPLETLQAYGDMAQLVLERDLKRAEYQRALEDYPPPITENGNGNNYNKDLVLPEGPWPGSDEWLTMGPKEQNPILVVSKRGKKGLFGAAVEELEAIGTWTAEPVLSEEDYEYVHYDEQDYRTPTNSTAPEGR